MEIKKGLGARHLKLLHWFYREEYWQGVGIAIHMSLIYQTLSRPNS
jgi:hypothetical protein